MSQGLSEKILEIIIEGIATTGDIISAILESGYRTPYSKLDRNYRKISVKRDAEKFKREELQRLRSLIYKLKQDGIITKKEKHWRITQRGRGKLQYFKDKLKNGVPKKIYKKETSPEIIIVAFDVPEKDRRKRDWLRSVLVSLDYKMLQKSVWLGKTRIPEEMLGDLSKLNLLPFIHIISISKSGTLKNL